MNDSRKNLLFSDLFGFTMFLLIIIP